MFLIGLDDEEEPDADDDLQQEVISYCSDEEVVLTNEYMQTLGKRLAANDNVVTESVCFKTVTLEDGNSICYLIDALSTNTTLQKLTLWNLDIDDGLIERFIEALNTNTTLRSLSLVRNDITSLGVEKLASFLAHNTTLEGLKLTGNSI